MLPARYVALLLLLCAGCGTGPSERNDLAQECVVAGATLATARSPIDLALARAGEALLYQTPDHRYALLAMPGCRVTPLLDVPERIGLSDVFVLPGGTRLFNTAPPAGTEVTWWFARGATTRPERLSFLPDPKSPYAPLLSSDGQWIVWPRSVREPDAVHFEIVMRHPDGTGETVVRLDSLEPDSYDLLGLNAAAREITLARHLNEIIDVGFDGTVHRRTTPADIEAQPSTFVRVGDGYFAWDATREHAAYRIGWSLPSGAGTLAFESLRRIDHAAVDPAGRFAAAGLETQYGRALSLSDAVVVVRLGDRREVFRAYQPRFTRSDVAFLTDAYVAYADANQVRVLRLPK